MKEAVVRHPHLVETIKNPSNELQMAVLKGSSNPVVIYQKIKTPSMQATQYTVKHIKAPSHLKSFKVLPERIAWHYLYKDVKNMRYIRSPTADMAYYAISQDPTLLSKYAKRLTPHQLNLMKRRAAGYRVPTIRIKPKGAPYNLWSNKQ